MLQIWLALWLAGAGPADRVALETRLKMLHADPAERAAVLGRLIEIDPRRALELASLQLDQWGSWDGTVTEIIADDFPGGKSERRVWLASGGESLELHFVREPGRLRTGVRVSVQGVRAGTRVAVATARVVGAAVTPPACTVEGDQKVAALLLKTPGAEQPALTAEEVQQSLFGNPGPSLDGYWRDASYGQTSASGDVFGWFTVPGQIGCDGLGAFAMSAIQTAWQTVDLTPYTRIYLYYPEPAGGCGWSAMGTVGCSPDVQASIVWMPIASWWTPGRMVELAAHEGGHSLGLMHADSRRYDGRPLGAPEDPGTRREYGDPFSMMGNSAYLGHYTAQQKLELNWLTPDQAVTVEGSGDYRVTPMETVGGVKALRVRRTTAPDSWLWLEFRQPIGIYDSTLPDAAFGGALIHYQDAQNSPGGDWAGHVDVLDFTPGSLTNDFQDAPLAAGQSWADPWTPRTIDVLNAAGDGLSVRVGDSACVTLSPLSRQHGPGQETGSIEVTAAASCQWTVKASADWIVPTSALSGAGSGTVTYQVNANEGSLERSGTLTIGRKAVLLTQGALNLPPTVDWLYHIPDGGPAGSFYMLFGDPNGTDDLRTFRLNISPDGTLAASCAVEFDAQVGMLRLANDAGDGWLGPVPYALADSLRNAQCQVQSASAYFGMASAELVFLPAFTGTRGIYASATDRGGLDSGWKQFGSWTTMGNEPPAAVSVTPSSGTGYSRTFAVVYSDPNGGGDIASAAATFTGGGSQCGVDVAWDGYAVLGNGSAAQGYLGGTGKIENAACVLDLHGSSLVVSGTELRVTLALTFKPVFGGDKDVILSARDRTGLDAAPVTAGHWTVADPIPAIAASGVKNAATLAAGPVAPGEMVVISGTDFGPIGSGAVEYAMSASLANALGESQVLFDGVPAPILYRLDSEIIAIVPYGVSGTTRVQVDWQGRRSPETVVPVAAASPGIFKHAGGQQGLIVNAEDNTSNGPELPAERGKVVALFATGAGQTTPPGVDGLLPLAGALPEPAGRVAVSFDGRQGEVIRAELISPGVVRIDVRIPADAPVGAAVPVSLYVGGVGDPKDTTIALK